MKNQIKCLCALLLMSLSTNTAAEQSDDSYFGQAIAMLEGGEKALCSEANLFRLKFSLRSFGDRLCSNKNVAALAELVCRANNVDNYNESNCHKNAQEALKGESPLLVLLAHLKANGATYESILCKAANISSSASEACEVIRLVNLYSPYLR